MPSLPRISLTSHLAFFVSVSVLTLLLKIEAFSAYRLIPSHVSENGSKGVELSNSQPEIVFAFTVGVKSEQSDDLLSPGYLMYSSEILHITVMNVA